MGKGGEHSVSCCGLLENVGGILGFVPGTDTRLSPQKPGWLRISRRNVTEDAAHAPRQNCSLK